MSEEDVRHILRTECKNAGTARAWAQQNECSEAYVCDVLKGRRAPGDTILIALGLRRVISYEFAESQTISLSLAGRGE